MDKQPQRLFLIAFTALILLAVLSACPWHRWTGGKLKDFSLISQLREPDAVAENLVSAPDAFDPELKKFEEQAQVKESAKADSVESVEPVKEVKVAIDFKAPERDGVTLIEDYTPGGDGLRRLKSKLEEASQRNVRIAMVGDSYIEGDILAQDIRAGLQGLYGGRGVGYMSAFSTFPGFRHSVNQTSEGWEEFEIRKMKADEPLRTILGHYHVAKESLPNVRYRGSVKPARVDHWTRTRVLFIAPSDGSITITGNDNTATTIPVSASASLQQVMLDESTSDLRISSDIAGLKVLGVWLEDSRGIVLDDISLRGNSGVSHRVLNASTTASMRQWIDYDLIILEFGMNALSASQKDYTVYGEGMAQVARNLKRLYPNALILFMGVGDRGTKSGTEVVSMATLPALIKAQRTAAKASGALFYDTRQAMGGEGAALDWHRRRLVNSDYVHLNHKGGKELAEIFLNSLQTSLQ